MIRYSRNNRNLQFKNESPSITEIPDLWRASVAMESLAPANLRGGLARARTRLLDAVEPWRLPDLLDQLLEGAI